MKTPELAAAEQALQDYFDSLSGEERERALAYQERLELMADMKGGMMVAIQQELLSCTLQTSHAMVDLFKLGAKVTSDAVLARQ